jgi:hypothetical protein
MRWLLRVLPLLALPLLAGVAPAGSAAAVVNHPRVAAGGPHGSSSDLGWASSNWSGYAVTGATYTSVAGSWTVPTVARSRKATYSSSWVGIDGFNNSSLIQTGTEQDYYSGAAHYYAWWEILPAAETVIPSIAVVPGNVMTASITQGSGGSWTITITDNSTGATFSTKKTYSGPGSSAEWIEEAPTVGGRIATLANYGSAVFDPGNANGTDPGLVALDGGVMIQGRSQVSTPSLPDGDTDGFKAAYGSTQPSPPSS